MLSIPVRRLVKAVFMHKLAHKLLAAAKHLTLPTKEQVFAITETRGDLLFEDGQLVLRYGYHSNEPPAWVQTIRDTLGDCHVEQQHEYLCVITIPVSGGVTEPFALWQRVQCPVTKQLALSVACKPLSDALKERLLVLADQAIERGIDATKAEKRVRVLQKFCLDVVKPACTVCYKRLLDKFDALHATEAQWKTLVSEAKDEDTSLILWQLADLLRVPMFGDPLYLAIKDSLEFGKVSWDLHQVVCEVLELMLKT